MSGGPPSVSVYLVVREDASPEALVRLAAALGATRAASLLIEPGDQPLSAGGCKPMVDLAQSRGVAALLSGDAHLARALRADGVHLSWSKDPIAAYEEARGIVGGRMIVGADAGRSRHDAMSLGEAGADYVAFGIPSHVEDRATARERQVDLVGWWAELFEVPCVAFDVASADSAAALAEAGADFVAFRADLARTEQDLAAELGAFVAALTPVAEAAP